MLLISKNKLNKKIKHFSYFHTNEINDKTIKLKKIYYLDEEVNKNYKNDNKHFKFINLTYNFFLRLLAKSLNHTHNENKSLDYWNIILGEWLYNLITEAFSHWNKIDLFLKKNQVLSFEKYKLESLTPYNYLNFHTLKSFLPWKNWLIMECLNYKVKNKQNFFSNIKFNNKQKKTHELLINRYFFLGNPKKIFLYKCDIKIKKLMNTFLEFKFLQLNLRKKKILIKNKVDFKKRLNLINNKFNSGFKNFIKKIIPFCIPSSYLENYKDYKNIISASNWPLDPNYILASYPFFDDVFKFYYANIMKNNPKLMVLQHGGIQSEKIKFKHTYRELKVYKNLTWGKKFFSKKDSILSFTKTDKKITKSKFNYNNNLRNIFLLYCWNENHSLPYGIGFDQYIRNNSTIENTKKFILSMNQSFQLKTDIKILNINSKNVLKEKLSKDLPFINQVDEKLFLQEIMSKYNLFIHYVFSTPFFECIYFNKPSIFIVDDRIMFFEMDKDLKKLLNKYEGIIFFKDYKKAVSFLKNTSIETWWNSREVQGMRKYFCNIYCNDSSNFIKNLKKIII